MGEPEGAKLPRGVGCRFYGLVRRKRQITHVFEVRAVATKSMAQERIVLQVSSRSRP